MQESQLIHWKPNQQQLWKKIVFLIPGELTVVKQKKVIYYSTLLLPKYGCTWEFAKHSWG